MFTSTVLLVFLISSVSSLRHETVKLRISQSAVDYSTYQLKLLLVKVVNPEKQHQHDFGAMNYFSCDR